MTTIFRRARAAGLVAAGLGAVAAGTAMGDEALGERIFMEGAGGLPACALCHVLADAGATGAIGPDLDQLRPDADRIRAAVRDGVGIMPAFGEALSAEEIEAVVDYVANAVAD
ncbi:MAG TPA: cytochrome c [Paracoccaceae bacterium]|nr:cytochrome c [Paracoccaceae bacterium]